MEDIVISIVAACVNLFFFSSNGMDRVCYNMVVRDCDGRIIE